MNIPILSLRVQYESDVVLCRQRARQIADVLGFDPQQQTRLATAVSEIARNTFNYGGGGTAEFFLEGATPPQLLNIRVTDGGPGIKRLDDILEGRYQSETGMGLGIIGARRLMDRFNVVTGHREGTVVTMGKLLPRRSKFITLLMMPQILESIASQNPRNLFDEIRDQNQELIRTLEELRARQQELATLNRELDDTNRGVVALYAELDEKADHLRRADEVKTRFLSNMSHEFRTPLNSILALSRILLDRTDGDLTAEQEVQVTYIRKSAESLFELVNDLLDIAKVEAGKITVRPVEFEVAALFGALRGMLRPLLVSTSLHLIFEDPVDIPPVLSDEGKVSQILRNFVSNALKFTEAGEVRVSAQFDGSAEGGSSVTFRVSDTGIGIAPEDLETIFQEFAQVDSKLQRKVKGTGLGLPLSRKLAQLLGGTVDVESQASVGSTFSLRIPLVYNGAPNAEPSTTVNAPLSGDLGSKLPVLLVEDHFETRLIYEKYLRGTPWHIVSARSLREATNVLRHLTPGAIILDVLLQGEDTWDLLARLKSDPASESIPIFVVTDVDDEGKAMALGADAFARKPLPRTLLLDTLNRLTTHQAGTVLVVDDEEVSRYLIRQIFGNPAIRFLEAENGIRGLALARAEKPDLIVTDLAMPEMNGFQFVEEISGVDDLKNVPVIVATSKTISSDQMRDLDGRVAAVLSKEGFRDSGAEEELRKVLRRVGLVRLMADADAEVVR
jgi:signal transduction histidine kinase/response regulator RpfG family c-di-GMP phosphodiesterase